MALVDVVLTTCDRPQLRRQAIDSVCKQTFTDWNLIVVDDASKIALDMPSPKHTYIRHKNRLG